MDLDMDMDMLSVWHISVFYHLTWLYGIKDGFDSAQAKEHATQWPIKAFGQQTLDLDS